MGGKSGIRAPWSSLPEELLEIIAKRLDTEIDVLRFRAVCSSWRSSTVPWKKFLCDNVKLPYPFSYRFEYSDTYYNLVERTVYRIELPNNSEQPNFWLLKVERLSNGELRIVNPASHHQIEYHYGTVQMPKVLNILDFRVSEVCKAYALRHVRHSRDIDVYTSYAKKVIFSKGIKDDDYFVMATDDLRNLWYIKSGDDTWTLVPSNGISSKYVDVVDLKGQIYGVDELGHIWKFDSTFEPTIFSNDTLYHCKERHLVESYNGELHLVEEVRDFDHTCYVSASRKCLVRNNAFSSFLLMQSIVEIKIRTFNKQDGKWGEAKLENGLIIFAGDDCSFSFSSKELEGCNGTRVFYTNFKCVDFQTFNPECYEYVEYDCCNYCQNIIRVHKSLYLDGDVMLGFGGLGHSTGVYDFETGKTRSLLMHHEYADIFWPPPSWLSPT